MKRPKKLLARSLLTTAMSHTYWDAKGMVKRRPGGYTYHGGNTHLSQRYKDRFVPHYDPATTMSKVDRTDELSTLNKSEKWNTYQKRMWYQDHLDHTSPEFEEFPGLHAEWRTAGDFDKSFRKYNSKFVYDFRVNVTTTDANGDTNTQQLRTADHTEVQRMRRDVSEAERFDVEMNRKTAHFPADYYDDVATSRPLTADDVDSPSPRDERGKGKMVDPYSRQSTLSNADNNDISYFNQDTSPSAPCLNTEHSSSLAHCSSTPALSGDKHRHPAINPRHCSEDPRETFRKKEKFPLFWSKGQKDDFRNHRASSALLDTTTGRTAHDAGVKSELLLSLYPVPLLITDTANTTASITLQPLFLSDRCKDAHPYASRHMTALEMSLRSRGSYTPGRPDSGTNKHSRRPQSGYERGLAGTLQKNDGWRDDSLLSDAGKISFHPLSLDVLETLTFPRVKGEQDGHVVEDVVSE